ncbi:MAG TPA: hypothetical protein VJQ59_07445 [Candidatus Sulfotelmatobacter sp.]|nr:hypothetical protein [Candidatus Sulfotelmatobacter sp.]
MFRWTATFLLLTGAALGQTFVDAPSATRERFLDKPNILLLASLTAWHGLALIAGSVSSASGLGYSLAHR